MSATVKASDSAPSSEPVASVAIKEGLMSRAVANAGQECQTWYQVHTPTAFSKVLQPNDNKRRVPVIILHGGPGASHDYLENHKYLASHYLTPTIFYDQLGNGRSTRLPEKAGDESFWTEELFVDELDALIDHLNLRDGDKGFDIIGHSWGGMLAIAFAARKPKGLKRLVLSGTPTSVPDWAAAGRAYRTEMPQKYQDAFERCEAIDDWQAPEYEEACDEFNKLHMCQLQPYPHPALKAALDMMSDSTVYSTMMGYSEVKVLGNLKDWTSKDRLKDIEAPCLAIHGDLDLAHAPWQSLFYEEIKTVTLTEMSNATHFAHVEIPDVYFGQVSEWLTQAKEPEGRHKITVAA